ncbi:MAG: hypothetical protein U0T74_12840 [Chitinophagales bacterium]
MPLLSKNKERRIGVYFQLLTVVNEMFTIAVTAAAIESEGRNIQVLHLTQPLRPSGKYIQP